MQEGDVKGFPEDFLCGRRVEAFLGADREHAVFLPEYVRDVVFVRAVGISPLGIRVGDPLNFEGNAVGLGSAACVFQTEPGEF